MKNLKDIIIEQSSIIPLLEKLKINSKSKISKYTYHPEDKDELQDLIKQLIKERGEEADLNDIDTSKITDMSYLFSDTIYGYGLYNFNGDISGWDVSNVTTMKMMFCLSKFDESNGDLANWDVSNVKSMYYMFHLCPLEKNPPKWYHE